MKVLTIIGARPQFIKAAPVSRAFSRLDGLREIIVHTGQHFDANMSDVFFSELEIPIPDYNLGVGGGTHGQNTGRMIEAVEAVILAERPDWVLVYGDTDSTLAGAIAASKLHVPVAHIEAGLRSFNMRMPEEINRKLTDHVSEILFLPSERARKNLDLEGIVGRRVVNVGDVMFDAVLMFADAAATRTSILPSLGISSRGFILATVHRQENTDDPERLSAILEGFGAAAWPVVLPLHPRTQQRLSSYGLHLPDNVIRVEPLGYLDMFVLELNALLIATDSGGIQKEAYFHKVPCITLRDETEWVELVELGWNRLVSPGRDDLKAALRTVPDQGLDSVMPYGDGNASTLIAETIQAWQS